MAEPMTPPPQMTTLGALWVGGCCDAMIVACAASTLRQLRLGRKMHRLEGTVSDPKMMTLRIEDADRAARSVKQTAERSRMCNLTGELAMPRAPGDMYAIVQLIRPAAMNTVLQIQFQ